MHDTQSPDATAANAMAARIPLLVGGMCAAIGALGIFGSNFLHPLPPSDRAAMLEVIAAEPAWSAIHLPTMFFAVLVLIGLVSLSEALTRRRAVAWASCGRIVAQVGVPVMLVGVAIDGYGFKVIADAWAAAPDAERVMLLHAADAIVHAETALLHTWVMFFLGLTFLCFGAAVTVAGDWPRALGALGIAGGAGCLFSGMTGFLRASVTIPFPIVGTLVLLWLAWAGVVMMRRGLDAVRLDGPLSAAPRQRAPV